jgi:hypothetical protein
MDSQLSEPLDALASLRESISHGDWKRVETIVAGIRHHTIPSTPEGLSTYLRDLRETILAVKVCRANLKLSRARLNAAAGFGASAIEVSSGRHNSAVSPGF